jgi:hypothetical protein
VLNTGYLPTTGGTVSTDLDTVNHAANLLTIRRTGFADFGADFTKTAMKIRVAELKIDGHLTYFCAVHHTTKMFYLNVLSTCLKAVGHGSL